MGLTETLGRSLEIPPPTCSSHRQMGPSLVLTVLYLKGHCRVASLPCSEQYTSAIESAGEEGKGGRGARRAGHRLLFGDA